MTLSNDYLIEISDLIALRFTCRKEDCGVSLNVPLMKLPHVPLQCPYCNAKWFEKGSSDETSLRQCLDALHALQVRNEKTACHLQLEIKELE